MCVWEKSNLNSDQQQPFSDLWGHAVLRVNAGNSMGACEVDIPNHTRKVSTTHSSKSTGSDAALLREAVGAHLAPAPHRCRSHEFLEVCRRRSLSSKNNKMLTPEGRRRWLGAAGCKVNHCACLRWNGKKIS